MSIADTTAPTQRHFAGPEAECAPDREPVIHREPQVGMHPVERSLDSVEPARRPAARGRPVRQRHSGQQTTALAVGRDRFQAAVAMRALRCRVVVHLNG